jgi:hypothetical protein
LGVSFGLPAAIQASRASISLWPPVLKSIQTCGTTPASGITGHSCPFTMTVGGGEACSEAFSRTNSGFSAGTRLLGLSGCQPSWMG